MRLGALVLIAPAAAFLCQHPIRAPGPHTALHATGPLGALHARPPLPHAMRVGAPARAVAGSPEVEEKQLDLGSIGRYIFAIIIQMILITTFFGAIDLACYGPLPGDVELGGPLPWQAVVGIFVGMSVRSRLFNFLDNSRPELAATTPEEDAALVAKIESGKTKTNDLKAEAEKRGLAVDGTMDRIELGRRLTSYIESKPASADGLAASDRVMPSWMPPGVTFPIMWLLVVAPLRAFSSSLIYEASTNRLNEAHLNDPVLLWLIFHLAIGDTWNTVNNVEKRLGAATVGVVLVFLSSVYAAAQYYAVDPLAGGLLGLTSVWIAVAGALVTDTWRLNGGGDGNEPLYPYKKEGMKSITRFWFED